MLKASVIIPAYNQADRLYLTLVSFAHQTSDLSQFEVIVVDDGSQDETRQVIRTYTAPYRLRCIHQANLGRAVARNRGVREADGEILIFNDCDRAVVRGFVEAHLSRHERQSNVIVVGSVYELFFGNLEARREALTEDIANNFARFGRMGREQPYAQAVSAMYAPDGTTNYHIPWISFLSGNISLSKQAFEQVQGFDEYFVGWGLEHFELGLRLYRAGFQYIYAPAARNFHFAHRRELDFYRSSLRASFEYLQSKHADHEVTLLRDFMRGEISLQEYEALITGKELKANMQDLVYFTKPVDF